jgi:hypothetical protein
VGEQGVGSSCQPRLTFASERESNEQAMMERGATGTQGKDLDRERRRRSMAQAACEFQGYSGYLKTLLEVWLNFTDCQKHRAVRNKRYWFG